MRNNGNGPALHLPEGAIPANPRGIPTGSFDTVLPSDFIDTLGRLKQVQKTWSFAHFVMLNNYTPLQFVVYLQSNGQTVYTAFIDAGERISITTPFNFDSCQVRCPNFDETAVDARVIFSARGTKDQLPGMEPSNRPGLWTFLSNQFNAGGALIISTCSEPVMMQHSSLVSSGPKRNIVQQALATGAASYSLDYRLPGDGGVVGYQTGVNGTQGLLFRCGLFSGFVAINTSTTLDMTVNIIEDVNNDTYSTITVPAGLPVGLEVDAALLVLNATASGQRLYAFQSLNKSQYGF